ETEIRAQLAEMEDRHRLAMATIKTEKSLIETELKRSQDERDKLQREIAAMKRDAENAGEYERMENAVLREHIDEVAAEVARLTRKAERAGPADRNNSKCGAPSSARRQWTAPARRPSSRRIQRHARRPHPYLAGACIARCLGSARPEAERSAAWSTRRQVNRTAGAGCVPAAAGNAQS